ncbi:MAG: PAS domain-containing protein [Acidobacteriaceae bacterium]|nr:PAS domain-containing protein [Acidobacteriaceae bacterium]
MAVVDARCLVCNQAAAELLGYQDPAELLGKNMHATEHHSRADGRPYPLEECPIYRVFKTIKACIATRAWVPLWLDEVFWRRAVLQTGKMSLVA